MRTDRPAHSPARQAGLLACLLLAGWGGAASEAAAADIFLSAGPNGETILSDRPPLSGSAIVLGLSGSRSGHIPVAESPASAAPLPDLAPQRLDAPLGDEGDRAAAYGQPFRPGGSIAPGKAFTAGD